MDEAKATSSLPMVSRNAGYQCLFEGEEPPSVKGNNFVKAAKWSPDGTHILTAHDDMILRLYRFPFGADHQSSQEKQILKPHLHIEDGGPIQDYCFFPGFTWDSPATCCFISSCQGHPIHLRNAADGTLINSYRPYNNVDEVCHASSLCFSLDGSRILAGFPSCIRFFDLQRPGRQVADWTLSTRKGRGQQKGIISALACSSNGSDLLAAGSYNRSICIYQQGNKSKPQPLAWLADMDEGYAMGGVTQLIWHDDYYLTSGHRRDRFLRLWDLRMTGNVQESSEQQPTALVHRFPRVTTTHQRFFFSVKGGKLATGNDSGDVILYSLSTFIELDHYECAHSCPCVSADLHPSLDLLLSASGSRCFPNYDVDSPDEANFVPPPIPSSPVPRKRARKNFYPVSLSGKYQDLDNSFRVWKLSCS